MNTRRTAAAVTTTFIGLWWLGGCSGTDPSTTADGDADRTYHIGISQIVSHPSLDDIAQGVQDAFSNAGIDAEFDLQNAQGDQSVAASIAGTFAESNLDLIVPIATPTAQAAAQAIDDVPIVFATVTDPVAAGLVDSLEAPGGNITGTTDRTPVADQFELITQLAPEARTVGVVYSSAEENSAVQVEWAKEAAAELGLEIRTATISTSAEIQLAAESLEVDAFWVPTDNTVVSGIEALIGVAEEEQVPVVTADGDSVERGAVATVSFNYYEMGVQTGELAIRILEGADPATTPVETSQSLLLYLNPAAAERMGVTIPQDLLDRAEPENIFG